MHLQLNMHLKDLKDYHTLNMHLKDYHTLNLNMHLKDYHTLNLNKNNLWQKGAFFCIGRPRHAHVIVQEGSGGGVVVGRLLVAN